MQISEIAVNLGVDNSTISKDIKFLVKDSHKFLIDMAKETLPFMYRQSIAGMQQILLESWARYRKDSNIFALRLALDCHKEIFNQAANGVSVLAVKKIRESQCGNIHRSRSFSYTGLHLGSYELEPFGIKVGISGARIYQT